MQTQLTQSKVEFIRSDSHGGYHKELDEERDMMIHDLNRKVNQLEIEIKGLEDDLEEKDEQIKQL